MQTRINDLSNSFNKVSALLHENSSLADVGPKILQELGSRLNCQWGTYWKVILQSSELRPVITWTAPGFEAAALKRDTKNRSLSINEGTAGHVWRSKKPIWTLDLFSDMCLPRSLDANTVGLTGGIWFPLKTEGTVVAVIELLGRHILSPTEELIVGIEGFGIHLGSLIKEKWPSE